MTRMEFLELKTSLEQKIDEIAETMQTSLDVMFEQIAMCVEQCNGPVNLSKRRHEDPENDPHEREK